MVTSTLCTGRFAMITVTYLPLFVTKSAEKPRRSRRGWIGVGRAGLNAQEPNKTHAVPEPSMGEGPAEVEAPAFMPGRTSQRVIWSSHCLIGLSTVHS